MKLPVGWVETNLREPIHQLRTGPFGSAVHKHDYMVGGVPLINPMHIKGGKIQPSENVTIGAAKAKALGDFKLCAGDVIIGRRGEMGRCAVIEDWQTDWLIGTGSMALTPSSALDSHFLQRFLASDDVVSALEGNAVGSTMVNLNQSILLNLPLPLPPLAEQRRIVAKLDALTARLARARAELDRVPVLAANLRKETLRNAFGQGAPDVPVKDLISDIRYGTAKKCDYGGGAVSVLRIPNVQGGRIDLTDMKSADFDAKELAKLKLVQGDILVIRSNGSLDLVGRSAIVDDGAAGMLFAGYLIRMRVDPSKCLPEYLHHFLQSPAARETLTMGAKSTSGVNNVNAQQLQALAVPLPDLSTQASLVQTIEQAFTRADRLEAEATRARTLLDRLEAAILARAFRGELVPQDPNDEPASVLLARIRQSRAAAPQVKRGRRAKAA